MEDSRYDALFEPLRLGPVTAPNRIAFTAHTTNLARHGLPDERVARYYGRRAEGGAGLITALLRLRLADQVAITVAPKILGSGIAAVGDLGIDDLDRARLIEGLEVGRYGDDIVLTGTLRYPNAEDS